MSESSILIDGQIPLQPGSPCVWPLCHFAGTVRLSLIEWLQITYAKRCNLHCVSSFTLCPAPPVRWMAVWDMWANGLNFCLTEVMALIKYFDWATPPVRSCASILCPVKWHQSTLKFIDTSWLYHIQLCIVSVGTLVWVVGMWLIAFDSLNRFLPPIQQHRYKTGLVSTWHWHTWRICISQMLWLGRRTSGGSGGIQHNPIHRYGQ